MKSPQAKGDGARAPGGGNVRTGRAAMPSRGPTAKRTEPAPDASAKGTVLGSVAGFVVAAGIAGAIAWASGCRGEAPPPGPSTDRPGRSSFLPAPPPPSATAKASASATTSIAAPEPKDAGAPVAAADAGAPAEKPYSGPLLGALALQTPIYATPEPSKKRLGYIRLGGKVPVDPTPIKNASCTQGWYKLLDGGYVCGRNATLDVNSPQVRLGITPPNLDDVLPYKYAYNTGHGTPLYRSVPSKEEMLKYEPYLEAAKRARRKAKKDADEKDDAPAPPATTTEADDKEAAAAAAAIGILDGGTPTGDEPAAPPKPWWQQPQEKGKNPSVTLAELEQDSDSTIAKRMVKGFWVAIDKTFGWNGRSWYKTTGTLVAPADRMFIVKPPTAQGIDVPKGVKAVGFVTGLKAQKYELDTEHKNVKVLGPAARFTAVGLTGVTASIKTIVYRQTTEGWWMKGIDGTYTDPGPPPQDLAPGEKWIDVNLTRKTLVAMEGDKMVYAALVSPGKKSPNKAKDHSTVKGTFRIREKHIAVTMDGDGTAAGDLPYSIEDVPFVEYFEGSYALHAAFWHNNFGHEMSHGCVNLSPLDAKKIFFWTEPKLGRGWHAAWATPENRGTIVVVHD
jgi:lipoprotein-anchoring transpeptidase ErfK/SrfK